MSRDWFQPVSVIFLNVTQVFSATRRPIPDQATDSENTYVTLFNKLIYSCFSRSLVSTNSVAPCSVYKHYATHNSSICSGEGLTVETSAFQSLCDGQFTLSTLLINQIFVYHSPTDAAPQFIQKLIPFTRFIQSVSFEVFDYLI